MVGHGGSSAGSYLADPASPIPSHCASIVVTSTVRDNYDVRNNGYYCIPGKGDERQVMYCHAHYHGAKKATIHQVTTILSTSKNVLLPGHNHLLATGADDSLVLRR